MNIVVYKHKFPESQPENIYFVLFKFIPGWVYIIYTPSYMRKIVINAYLRMRIRIIHWL
jgi:hypothetical protein